jgi:hypothetical protein
MTRPYSQTHIQYSWVRCYSQTHLNLGPVLQPDSLKLGSCKFNFIINIINITLRSYVVAKPKILGYNFAEKLNIFKFLFFLIFFM